MDTTNLSTHKYVAPYDSYYKISRDDYDPNYLQSAPNITIVCGMSKSGKSTLLANWLAKRLIFEFDPNNIIFFSKTIKGDTTYKPIFAYLAEHAKKLNIHKSIKFNVIDDIMSKQETITNEIMVATSAQLEPVLPKYLFVFDDVIGDK